MVIDRLISHDASSVIVLQSPDEYNNASSFDKIFAAYHQSERMLQNNKSSLYADDSHVLTPPARESVPFNINSHTDITSSQHGLTEVDEQDMADQDKQIMYSANSDTEVDDEEVTRSEDMQLENHVDADATTHAHGSGQQQKTDKQVEDTLLHDNKEARDVSATKNSSVIVDTSNTVDNAQAHQHLASLNIKSFDIQKNKNIINQKDHPSRRGDTLLPQEVGDAAHTSKDRFVSVREITENINTTHPSDKAIHANGVHQEDMSHKEFSHRNSNAQDQKQARSGQDHVRISVIDRSAYDQHVEPKNNTLKIATFENKNIQDFKYFLDREASSSVIKHARFVFHNNTHSEVRILLRPAELGTMKLKLFMQNDAIHGKIIVDNIAARDVVENGILDIQKMIRGQGFQDGSIDVDINPRSHSAPYYKNHPSNASRLVLPNEDKEIYPVLKNNDTYANSLLINLYA